MDLIELLDNWMLGQKVFKVDGVDYFIKDRSLWGGVFKYYLKDRLGGQKIIEIRDEKF